MESPFRIRHQQSVLLVVTTAIVTWFISTWLSFVHYGHLHTSLVALGAARGGYGYDRIPNDCRSSSSSSSPRGKNNRQSTSSSTTNKRRVWANLSLIDDPNSEGVVPSRVYEPFRHPFPCFPGEKHLQLVKPAHQGILFHRPQKTGTTTTAGIVMRLAHSRYESLPPDQKATFLPAAPRCLHRSNHGSATELEYHKRDRSKSFLFSLIRDPVSRAVSQFFHFDVTVGQNEPTDEHFMAYLKQPHMSTVYLRDLRADLNLKPPLQIVHRPPNITHDAVMSFPYEGNYTTVVQGILDSYDLIMVSERIDESLVVLKLLLGLTFDEILYLRPARSGGSFSNGPPKDRPCIYIIPSFITPTVSNFLRTDPVWQQRKEGDEMLYLAAVKSLDRTIDALGRRRVQDQVETFHQLRLYAQSQCSGPTDVVSMCSDGGKRNPPSTTTCYIWGEGCDHVCLNNITYPPHLLKLMEEDERPPP